MPRRVKVGMIFECGPQGADKKVCEDLAKRLLPTVEPGLTVEVVSVTKTNKKIMMSEAGEAAKTLLADGCHHVVVIWDLYPPWATKEKPCRHNDKEQISASLKAAKVSHAKVLLVCVEAELEAWLLADHVALDAYIGGKMGPHAHKRKVPRSKNPEGDTNPKKTLMQIFAKNGLGPYSDLSHAHQIAAKITDVSKLKKCATFKRFALKVAGMVL